MQALCGAGVVTDELRFSDGGVETSAVVVKPSAD